MLLNIVFVIGDPGVGKGTQCSLLRSGYPDQYLHLTFGDILRRKVDNPESMKNSVTGGKEMTVGLLVEHLSGVSNSDKEKAILLDGFPRSIDRALLFESWVCKHASVVMLNAPRNEWDPQVTKNRLDAWEAPMREVLVYYRDKGRLVEIDADREVEEVREDFGAADARHT